VFLTGAVGLGEQRAVTQIVLQAQHIHAVHTPIGGEEEAEAVAWPEHGHQHGASAIAAARTAACIHCGGVWELDLHCCLRERERARESESERERGRETSLTDKTIFIVLKTYISYLV